MSQQEVAISSIDFPSAIFWGQYKDHSEWLGGGRGYSSGVYNHKLGPNADYTVPTPLILHLNHRRCVLKSKFGCAAHASLVSRNARLSSSSFRTDRIPTLSPRRQHHLKHSTQFHVTAMSVKYAARWHLCSTYTILIIVTIGLCGASVRSLWFFIIYQHLLQADKIKNGLQMKQCL